MKKRAAVLAFLLFGLTMMSCTQADLNNVLQELESTVLKENTLSYSDIVKGLKQALSIGTNNAVTYVSKSNGYFGNPQIKIPLPEKVRKVEDILRSVGYGKQVDAFELSMNRAAEKAAPLAVDIFKHAITQMSFSDARQILDGPDNAATAYFRGATYDRLQQTFKPIISRAMTEVGVTRNFKNLNSRLAAIPFVDQLSFDLDRYTTNQALDGLFLMLANEEEKIRKDPAARVTSLLKKVFGKSGN